MKKIYRGSRKFSKKIEQMMKFQNAHSFEKSLPTLDENSYDPMNTNFYRTIDSDEFPIGSYIQSKTGRGITHFYKSNSHNGKEMCHHPIDIDVAADKFGLNKIYSFEYWEPEEKVINCRFVYELHKDDGVLLLLVSNYPKQYKNNKFNKKANISVSIVSNGTEETFNEVRDYFIETYKKVPLPPNNVHLVVTSHGGYDTETFDLPKQKIDIELNYGKDFLPIHNTILDKLNKQKGKGLVLLHGDPGTGKTHYLKYLASKIRNKRVLFIPPFLADFITSPDMIPFLIENSNSVLFIEDAERVITDRNENGSNGVSNILNITDGILSDILNIQIVATFNMDKKKIDSALLRKGRLIAEHKFEALTTDESNKLLKNLGSDYVTKEPMTLTEIYNYKDKHYVSEDQTKRPIGFGFNR